MAHPKWMRVETLTVAHIHIPVLLDRVASLGKTVESHKISVGKMAEPLLVVV